MNQTLDANSRRARTILDLCALGLLAALISYLCVDVLNQTRYGRRSTHWPTVTATMTSAEPMPTSTNGVYELDVQYQYTVDNGKFEGNRHRFHAMQGNYTKCKSIANTLMDKQDIVIRYAPDDPSLSVIEPGITMGELAECAIAAVLGILVLSGFLAAFAIDLAKMHTLSRENEFGDARCETRPKYRVQKA